MKMELRALAGSIVLSCAATGASAQPVYRCGSQYSYVPCPGATPLDVNDPRSAAQRTEARDVARRERALADQMERDRRSAAAAQKPQLATGFDSRASQPERAASAAQHAKGKRQTKHSRAKASDDAVTYRGSASTRKSASAR